MRLFGSFAFSGLTMAGSAASWLRLLDGDRSEAILWAVAAVVCGLVATLLAWDW